MKRMMKIRIFLFSFFVLFFPATAIAQEIPISLPNSIIVKLKSSVEVRQQSEISVNVPLTSRKLILRRAETNFIGAESVGSISQRLNVSSAEVINNNIDQGRSMVSITLPTSTSVNAAIDAYRQDPNVEYAEPNYILKKLYTPNDPYLTANPLNYFQWNLARINMPAAWNISQGGVAGVKVAVIDSGVAFENFGAFSKAPELNNVNFVAPKNFKSITFPSGTCSSGVMQTQVATAHPNDDDGHGTHVSGTIAQASNNGTHAAGIAFNVSIIPIKVLHLCNDSGGPTAVGVTSDTIAGINHAVASGAKVINMSLGGSQYSQSYRDAVIAAVNAGVTVIAATGNSASRTSSPAIGFPAGFPEVIAVGATRWDNVRAEYSQYTPVNQSGITNRQVDVVAPGGQTLADNGSSLNDLLDQNNDQLPDGIVQQTIRGGSTNTFTSINAATLLSNGRSIRCFFQSGSYLYFKGPEECGLYQGTSMATPHVSAVAALMLSLNPNLTPAQIKTILKETAQKTNVPGYNVNEYGAGLIDAAAALTRVNQAIVTPTPTPTTIVPTATVTIRPTATPVITPTVTIRPTATVTLAPGVTVTPTAVTTPTVTPVTTNTPVVTSTVGPSATATPPTRTGDANNDNLVNEADFNIWLSHYGQMGSGGASVGDFNVDGSVDEIDYVIWLNTYNG